MTPERNENELSLAATSLPATDFYRRATWAFTFFVLAVILAADLGSPLLDAVGRVPGSDFTGHLVLIGTLAFLANGWARQPIPGGLLLRGSAIVAGLVLLEEISQIWLPSRAFSVADLVADGLGILLADRARRLLTARRPRHGLRSIDESAPALDRPGSFEL